MPALLLTLLGAIIGSVVTWYLQRKWTPDPAAAVAGFREHVTHNLKGQPSWPTKPVSVSSLAPDSLNVILQTGRRFLGVVKL
jgi:hypothetical protein